MVEEVIRAAITFLAEIHDSLPPLDSTEEFALNGLALLSIGLFVSKPFISTKGGVPRDKDNNEIVTTNMAVILLMIALIVLFSFTQLIDVLYNAAILSGYQAAGVFIICSTQYIISNTKRKHTGLTKALILVGLFLIFGEIA